MLGLVKKISGIKHIEDCKISEVCRKGSKIEIRTKDGRIFQSAIVIGCDGAHSLIRRSLLGANVDKAHHATAIRAYFKNVSDVKSNTLEFHFLRELVPGYFWIFPVSDSIVNVGLGIPTGRIREEKTDIQALFNRVIKSNKSLKKRFANAVCEQAVEAAGIPYGAIQRPVSGEGFMLCGDAASIADPLTGEGIGQAPGKPCVAPDCAWHPASSGL